MAFLNNTTTVTLSDRFNGIIEGIATRYRRHRIYRETFDGLNALTNRELADLGLHRSELSRVAAEAAQR